MEIIWLGHSCFRLRSDALTLITDPFPDSVGITMGSTSAQMITVSHNHVNHSYENGVSGEKRVFAGPGEYEYLGILLKGIMTTRGDGDPAEKRNTAYYIEMEGVRLCHLGDISNTLAVRQIDELTPVDVLFLPVGEVCTVTLTRTLEILRALNPKIVVPMHYDIPGLKVKLGSVEPFLRGVGVPEAAPLNRLNVTPTNLPPERRVVILNHQGTVT